MSVTVTLCSLVRRQLNVHFKLTQVNQFTMGWSLHTNCLLILLILKTTLPTLTPDGGGEDDIERNVALDGLDMAGNGQIVDHDDEMQQQSYFPETRHGRGEKSVTDRKTYHSRHKRMLFNNITPEYSGESSALLPDTTALDTTSLDISESSGLSSAIPQLTEERPTLGQTSVSSGDVSDLQTGDPTATTLTSASTTGVDYNISGNSTNITTDITTSTASLNNTTDMTTTTSSTPLNDTTDMATTTNITPSNATTDMPTAANTTPTNTTTTETITLSTTSLDTATMATPTMFTPSVSTTVMTTISSTKPSDTMTNITINVSITPSNATTDMTTTTITTPLNTRTDVTTTTSTTPLNTTTDMTATISTTTSNTTTDMTTTTSITSLNTTTDITTTSTTPLNTTTDVTTASSITLLNTTTYMTTATSTTLLNTTTDMTTATSTTPLNITTDTTSTTSTTPLNARTVMTTTASTTPLNTSTDMTASTSITPLNATTDMPTTTTTTPLNPTTVMTSPTSTIPLNTTPVMTTTASTTPLNPTTVMTIIAMTTSLNTSTVMITTANTTPLNTTTDMTTATSATSANTTTNLTITTSARPLNTTTTIPSTTQYTSPTLSTLTRTASSNTTTTTTTFTSTTPLYPLTVKTAVSDSTLTYSTIHSNISISPTLSTSSSTLDTAKYSTSMFTTSPPDNLAMCSTTTVNMIFLETDTNQTCNNQNVTCNFSRDSLPPVLGNASLPFVISPTEIGGHVSLQVCTTDSLFQKVGDYELSIENDENTTVNISVMWYIRIEDVNQPPKFSQDKYEFSVDENAPIRSVLANVEVTNGTNSTANTGKNVIILLDEDIYNYTYTVDNYTITSIRTYVVNEGRHNDTIPLPFYMMSDAIMINGTVQIGLIYNMTITAIDRGGLTGKTTITVNVIDVNDPPFCKNSISSINISLLTRVDTAIYRAGCTDRDINGTFSALTYREYNVSDFEYFSISENGTVYLQQLLPVTKSLLTYSLYVQDGGGLVVNFTLAINVSRDFPPTCQPINLNLTFKRTDRSCQSDILTCWNNGSLSTRLQLNFTIVGNQTLFQLSHSTNATNVISVCPSSSLAQQVGKYSWSIRVSNELGSVSVPLTVSVEDVNEPPSFENASYSYSVFENVTINTPIASVFLNTTSGTPGDIRCYDPNTVGNFSIQRVFISSVLTVYANGSKTSATPPVQLLPDRLVWNASIHGTVQHVVLLTVEDGGGVNDSTLVNITVKDVNEPPVCDLVLPVNLDLLTQIGQNLSVVKCSDPDFDISFKTLIYSSAKYYNYTYFNVSASGEVTLAALIPRNARELKLTIVAQDGGGLLSNVTVLFNILSNYPPICTPVFLPPTVWRKDQCFRVYPHCQDPVGKDNSTLTYNFTGNFLAAFKESPSPRNSTYRAFCYLNSTNGTFDLTLEISNGLGVFEWNISVNVYYFLAVPVFSQLKYDGMVNETAPVGQTVLTVNATVSNSSVLVVYSLIGQGDFNYFFEINNVTGVVTVLTNLSLKADVILQADVWALDPETGVNSSVPLSIKVQDINQPPQCAALIVNSTVLWNLTQGSIVARVNCTDPDTSQNFSRLVYRTNATSTWTLNSSNGEISLKSGGQLDPNVGLYSFHVNVTDGYFLETVRVYVYVYNLAQPEISANLSNIQSNYFVVENATISATCNTTAVGVTQLSFQWTMPGALVSSGPQLVNSWSNFNSSQVIENMKLSEDGTLSCRVSGTGDYANVSRSSKISINVVSKMRARLSTKSGSVKEGSDVNLTCKRIFDYTDTWNATLYTVQNGKELIPVNTSIQNTTDANFTVKNVTTNTTFECDVRDSIDVARSSRLTVFVLREDQKRCKVDGQWPDTPAGETINIACPEGYGSGGLVRKCATNGEWEEADSTACVRTDILVVKEHIDKIRQNTSVKSTDELVDLLANATTNVDLLQGDVTNTVDILNSISAININGTAVPKENEIQKYMAVADNMLQVPSNMWKNQTDQALGLFQSLDTMGDYATRQLDNSSLEEVAPVVTDKIVLYVSRTGSTDIMFPDQKETNGANLSWALDKHASVFLPKEIFSGIPMKYSALVLRNFSNVLADQVATEENKGDNSSLLINSPLMSVTLRRFDGSDAKPKKPIILTFKHLTNLTRKATCRFLNTSSNTEEKWSDIGCTVVTTNDTATVCSCDHLTNFAILMSPYRPTGSDAKVLDYLSIIGISISIFFLFVTIIFYFVLWKYVKSDRSVILVNLCVVLLLADVTFLAGVNRTEKPIPCKIVAALLHYLFLTMFFLNLCEGLDIFISIVIVFPIKSVLTWLLVMAYGVPLIVVAVSLGIRLDGYGGQDSCWLSLDGGLLWAFVGPGLAALCANFFFVFVVMRALAKSTTLVTRTAKEKTKSIIKAICVVTPILGLTWIFGVFSVNQATIVFQYLFLIFNSIQGLFIFIFHCILSKQVREGIRNKRRRYRARSSAGDASSKYVSQKQTSESTVSHDNDRKPSPFLQADEHMQRVAAKFDSSDDYSRESSVEVPKDVLMNEYNSMYATTDIDTNGRAADDHITSGACNLRTSKVKLNQFHLTNSGDNEPQEDYQFRLDEVYGPGARISTGSDEKMGWSFKNVFRSSDRHKSTELSPFARPRALYSEDQRPKELRKSAGMYIPTKQPPTVTYGYDQPSSPVRLDTKAESLRTHEHYYPLGGPPGASFSGNRSSGTKQPPRVASKPVRNHNPWALQ